MAITEYYPSRGMHITKEGTTVTKYFTCSAIEWNAQTDGTITFPLIGDKYSEDRPDLRVTDISQYPIAANSCRVEILYSTIGMSHKSHRADMTSSIEESFDFSLMTEDASKYWDYTNAKEQVWTDVWEAADADNTLDNVPPLQKFVPHITYTIKMNLSKWDFNTIRKLLGTVNDSDFISQMKAKYPLTRPDELYDASGDDTKQWLFASCTTHSVGDDNVEFTMTFIHNYGHVRDETVGIEEKDRYINSWNKPYGVTTDMYRTTDFTELPYPEETDDTVDDGLR